MVNRQIGSRAQVMNGTAHHTSGGLTKGNLKYNKHGSIVSKKKSDLAKKNPALREWALAVKKCRKELDIVGFVPVGGRSAAGKKLLKCVRERV